MPDYSLLKTLHILAVILFVTGFFPATIIVARSPSAAGLAAMRRWDKWVTGPALGAVWILGVTLAIQGGWFHSGWLPTKLVFAVMLSALHGIVAGRMKRLARGEAAPSLRLGPYLVVGSTAAILVLVLTKPF